MTFLSRDPDGATRRQRVAGAVLLILFLAGVVVLGAYLDSIPLSAR